MYLFKVSITYKSKPLFMKHLWIIWVFALLSVSSFGQELHNKTFFIKSKYTGKVWDVVDASRDNRANIQQWPLHRGNNQKFKFVKAERWYYYIRPVHSNKAVSAANCSTVNNGNILQLDFHGGNNQQFYVGQLADGSYFIQSKCSFLLLGVSTNRDNINIFHGKMPRADVYSFELIPAGVSSPSSSQARGSVSGRFTVDGVFPCSRYHVIVYTEERPGEPVLVKKVAAKADCSYLITGIPDGTYKITGYLQAKVDMIVSQTKETITIRNGGRDRVDFGSRVN
jgi:hypothetical protein